MTGTSLEENIGLHRQIQEILGRFVTHGCAAVLVQPSKSAFMTTEPVGGRDDRFTLYGIHRDASGQEVFTTHGLQHVESGDGTDSFVAHPLNDASRPVSFCTAQEVGVIKDLSLMQLWTQAEEGVSRGSMMGEADET